MKPEFFTTFKVPQTWWRAVFEEYAVTRAVKHFVCEVEVQAVSDDNTIVLVAEDGGEPVWCFRDYAGHQQSFHPTKKQALNRLHVKALERARRMDEEARKAWMLADALLTAEIEAKS